MNAHLKRQISLVIMLTALLILLLGIHFEKSFLMRFSFIVSVIGIGFPISNIISRFNIENKSIHLWLTLIMGGICIHINGALYIGIILLCISSGLLIDKIIQTKNN